MPRARQVGGHLAHAERPKDEEDGREREEIAIVDEVGQEAERDEVGEEGEQQEPGRALIPMVRQARGIDGEGDEEPVGVQVEVEIVGQLVVERDAREERAECAGISGEEQDYDNPYAATKSPPRQTWAASAPPFNHQPRSEDERQECRERGRGDGE